MMSEWKEYKLGDVINLKRGYDLPNALRKAGFVPIFSSSGITDYHNEVMKKAHGVITGRYGTIGKVFFAKEDYWPLNTTLYVQDFKGNYPQFIFYFLKNFDFEKYNDKSAVPEINRNDVHTENVIIPEVEEQIQITSILSSLDDKIDLLHRQNKTLEQLAELLFRKWFVEDAEESWEIGTIEDEFDFTMGQSPLGSALNEIGEGMIFFQGRTDFSFRFPEPRVYTTTPTRLAKKFDTLVSVRAPVGDMNMAIEECCL